MGLNKTFALTLAAAMSLASAASAQSLIAAFDINGSTDTGTNTGLATTGFEGLTVQDPTATDGGVTLTVDGVTTGGSTSGRARDIDGVFSGSGPGPDIPDFDGASLIHDFFFSISGFNGQDGTLTATVTGLDADTDFEFTVYSFDNENPGGVTQFTIDGAVQGTIDNDPAAFAGVTDQAGFDAALAAQSLTFVATADATGTVEIDITDGSGGGTGIRLFNALTVSAIAVPEPSSATLLGLGMVGLFVRRRR